MDTPFFRRRRAVSLALLALTAVALPGYGSAQATRTWTNLTNWSSFTDDLLAPQNPADRRVFVDATGNTYLLALRDGAIGWSKFDPSGNRIGNRIIPSWNGQETQIVAVHVNASGAGAVLTPSHVLSFNTNGVRQFARRIGQLLPLATAQTVHVAGNGNVLIGGSVGTASDVVPVVIGLSPTGATQFVRQINNAVPTPRGGSIDQVGTDGTGRIIVSGIQTSGSNKIALRRFLTPAGVPERDADLVLGAADRLLIGRFDAAGNRLALNLQYETGGSGLTVSGLQDTDAGTTVANNASGQLSRFGSAFARVVNGAQSLHAYDRNGTTYMRLLIAGGGGWESATIGPDDVPNGLTVAGGFGVVQTRRDDGDRLARTQFYQLSNGVRTAVVGFPAGAVPAGIATSASGNVLEPFDIPDATGLFSRGAYLRSVNPNSAVQWVQRLGGITPRQDEATTSLSDPSGATIAAGRSGPTVVATRVDRAGRRTWTREIFNVATGTPKLISAPGGDAILLVALESPLGPDTTGIARIDGATGTVEWQRVLDHRSFLIGHFPTLFDGVVTSDNQLTLVGTSPTGVENVGMVLRVSAINGNTVWWRLLDMGRLRYNTVSAMPDGSIVAGGSIGFSRRAVVSRFSRTGTLQWTRGLGRDGLVSFATASTVGADGNIYIAGTEVVGPNQATVWSLTPGGEVRWRHNALITGQSTHGTKVIFDRGSVLLAMGDDGAPGIARLRPTDGVRTLIRLLPNERILRDVIVRADGTIWTLSTAVVDTPDSPQAGTRSIIQRWSGAGVAQGQVEVLPSVPGALARFRSLTANGFNEVAAVGTITQDASRNDIAVTQIR